MPVLLFFNRFPITTEETTPEMEELSGEGSGNPDGPKVTWTEASGDIDYPNFVHPEKKDELSEGDLKDENMIPWRDLSTRYFFFIFTMWNMRNIPYNIKLNVVLSSRSIYIDKDFLLKKYYFMSTV